MQHDTDVVEVVSDQHLLGQPAQQSGPSANSTAQPSPGGPATPDARGAPATVSESLSLAVRRRRIEVERRRLELEHAEAMLKLDERELDLERESSRPDESVSICMQKAEAWLVDTDRPGEAPQPPRDGGAAPNDPLTQVPVSPIGPVGPTYDWTRRIDEDAGRHREYMEWRRAADESLRRSQDCRSGRPERDPGMADRDFGYGGQVQSHRPYNYGGLGVTWLSESQIAARKATTRELPTFSGEVGQWPIFISNYENSTAICGYSDEENLLRLQRALKGPALESVEHLLLLPTGLSEVISALRTQFGRPELIVETLIEKVRKMPAPKAEKFESIVAFGIAVRNMCATIRVSGLRDYMCNVTLLRELTAKLPHTTRLDWARHKQRLPSVSLMDFGDWIGGLAQAVSSEISPLTSLHEPNVRQPSTKNTVKERGTDRRTDNYHTFINTHTPETPGSSRQWSCPLCQGLGHTLVDCERFIGLTSAERCAFVRTRNLCKKCLGWHKKGCYLQSACGKNGCSGMHHVLLHNDNINQPDASEERQCLTHAGTNDGVLLRYVPVTLYGEDKCVQTFAFLDEGSTSTFIDRGLVDELGIRGVPHPLCLRWTGNTTRTEADSIQLSVRISGVHQGATIHDLHQVHTMRNLSLPMQSLSADQLAKTYTHLKGLPVASYHKAVPRILIGMDNVRLGRPFKSSEGSPGEPVAFKTRLGWTIFGPCPIASTPTKSEVKGCHYHICTCNEEVDKDLNSALKDYFSLESIGISCPTRELRSADDERALKILSEKTCLTDGRYETGLLWKYDDVALPSSKEMALRRHACLMKKMRKDPLLAKAIRGKMEEYEEKGYIRRLTSEELKVTTPQDWYLPIFPVVNPNKPGKIRMVFDAAAKVSGVSLNTFLLTGPDQLVGLIAVLYKFREHRIAIAGDIREMFFQVKMRLQDQRSQMFFWADNEHSIDPIVFVVTVMTFGAACSPSSAHYVKNVNADRFVEQFPLAAQCIKYEHYVDDMLASVESEDEALKLAKDVRYVHAQGGFEIRNWISNSKRLVEQLQQNEDTDCKVNMCTDLQTEKVLGMWWDTATDVFTFRLNPRHNKDLLTLARLPTKREVLCVLMMIYDPLGLIGQYLMYLKILLQEIWRCGIDWDQQINDRIAEKWATWIAVLPDLEKTAIPRCYRSITSSSVENIQLHIFCDASESGMAAVAYLRFEEHGVVECALVGSKTRVAPLKFLSIPRLELQAAVIGARLAETIKRLHRVRISKRVFWTDSRNVVCWLKSDHRRYNQFVAFRVGELLESTDIDEWRWVPTKCNVADLGTKWQKIPEMTPSSPWFRGPSFLWEPESKWPVTTEPPGETDEEVRHNLLYHATQQPFIQFQRFSKWNRLLRTVGYVIRFVENIRSRVRGSPAVQGPLTQEELCSAEQKLLRQIQLDQFSAEIACLENTMDDTMQQGSRVKKTSQLCKLSPEVDEHGVLRMCGRLASSQVLDPALRKPVILPRRHYATDLLIQRYHELNHHCNHMTTISEIRRKYYIPRIRQEYNRVRHSCQLCKIRNVTSSPPMMGEIPPQRTAIAQRAFSYTGLDYFGPMIVVVGRRTEKRWGAIFTCLTTRAIHLEVVHSLTTNSCILAIRRFIARRGSPREIISDRGTNFVGAARELSTAPNAIDDEAVMTAFVGPQLKWTFNPPGAPHFGGCWERLVQSVKRVMCQMILPKLPTDEVLQSTLTEIELVVNSRPLTYVPLDDDQGFPITPNDLLLGSSNGTKPAAAFDASAKAVKSAWSAAQQNADLFWKKWVADYLPTLTRRTKWHHPVRPIEKGDVVVIVDNNLPRNSWPMGRVIAVVQARDGQVRRATVQTGNGVFERPATKIAVLDVQRK